MALGLALPLHGSDSYWNAISGNFSSASNWSGNVVPLSSSVRRLFFNTLPGLTNATSAFNNLGSPFSLNALTFGGATNFSLSGNDFLFTGNLPTLFNNSTGVITINNTLQLAANTVFNGITESTTVIAGAVRPVVSGAGLSIAGGRFIFTNPNTDFSMEINVTGGTFEFRGNTSHTLATAGQISTSGNGRFMVDLQGLDSNLTLNNRTFNFGAGGATGANANLIQSTGSIRSASRYNLDNGTHLIFKSDMDQNGVGELFFEGSTFSFGSGGGLIDFQGPIGIYGANFSTIVNTTGNNQGVLRYGSKDSNSGWYTDGIDLDIVDVSRTVSGTGNFKLDIYNGAMVHFYDTDMSNIQMTFSGHEGGSAQALSGEGNVGRLNFYGGYGQYNFGSGLIFENAAQVSTDGTGEASVLGNIIVSSGETAFSGGFGKTGTYNLTIGDGSGRGLFIMPNAKATFDISFRDDLTNVAGVRLLNDSWLFSGSSLNFRQTSFNPSSTYGNIYVGSNIYAWGEGSNLKGESIVRFEDSIGGVTSDAATTLSRQVIIDPKVNLFVFGSGTGGLRVEGSKANVDQLLTSQRLQNQVQSLYTGDQGTLTIAYTDNASRTFTNSDGPAVGSWIKLGFDNGFESKNSTLYQLDAASGTGGYLSNYNGLVIKQSGYGTNTVQLLSDLKMVGGNGDIAGTSFILENGTFRIDNGEKGSFNMYVGNADLQSGSIVDDTIISSKMTTSTGGVYVQGTITKTTSGTVELGGRIIGNAASTGNPTAIGLDIQQGTISQLASNLITEGTNMQLSGGTWALNGFSQEDGHLGTLTVTKDSIIDFGSGNASKVYFADSSKTTWEGNLIIMNWNGVPFDGGGNTQLFFGSGGLTQDQLQRIYFYNPNGLSPGYYQASFSRHGECVPVPEASTVFGGMALAAVAVGYEIRRRKKISTQ